MLTLTRGADSLVVAPESGGAIMGWSRGGRDVLHRGGPGAACFPLVPYANRIALRRFAWNGETYELAPNFGDHPHAIHGVGWKSHWTIESHAEDHAILSLTHDPSIHWPFAFAARLTYRFDPLGLTIEMEAANQHVGPAPMGLGVHPYFPRTPDAAIAFRADGVFFNDRTALPVRHGPVPPAWSHAAGRAVDREPLDNCFTGWDGVVTIPGLRIEAAPVFGDLQVYTPVDKKFFCVEPVSHVPDAINRTCPEGQAMTILAPGETRRGAIRFLPEAAG